MKYYLFELGYSVVKQEGVCWYRRDRKNHEWVKDMEWLRRYYDAQYDVIEIDYSEAEECITGRKPIPGFWSIDQDKLLNPEQE